MTLLSSEQIRKLKVAFEGLDANQQIAAEENKNLKTNMLVQELGCNHEFLIENFLKTFKSKNLLVDIYKAAFNREARNHAMDNQQKTYKSCDPCVSTKHSKSGCGNYLRYTSNGGCSKCQNSKKSNKELRENQVAEIARKHSDLSHMSPIVKDIVNNTDIPRATAYRLLEKFINNKSMYNKSIVEDFEAPNIPGLDIIEGPKMTIVSTKSNFAGLIDPNFIEEAYEGVDTSSEFDEFNQLDEFNQDFTQDEFYQESYDEYSAA